MHRIQYIQEEKLGAHTIVYMSSDDDLHPLFDWLQGIFDNYDSTFEELYKRFDGESIQEGNTSGKIIFNNNCTSIIWIPNVNQSKEFSTIMNTLSHEIYHAVHSILNYFDIECNKEMGAYTMGWYIGECYPDLADIFRDNNESKTIFIPNKKEKMTEKEELSTALMLAFINDNTIQFYDPDEDWVDIDPFKNPQHVLAFKTHPSEYRVKPKIEYLTPEALKATVGKQVEDKSGIVHTVTDFYPTDAIQLSNVEDLISKVELHENWKFLDGTKTCM